MLTTVDISEQVAQDSIDIGHIELMFVELFEQEWRCWSLSQPSSVFKDEVPEFRNIVLKLREALKKRLEGNFQKEYEVRHKDSFFVRNGHLVPLFNDEGFPTEEVVQTTEELRQRQKDMFKEKYPNGYRNGTK